MHAHTRSFQLDSQEYFMPHISRMQEDMQMYNHSSNDKKDQIWEVTPTNVQ